MLVKEKLLETRPESKIRYFRRDFLDREASSLQNIDGTSTEHPEPLNCRDLFITQTGL